MVRMVMEVRPDPRVDLVEGFDNQKSLGNRGRTGKRIEQRKARRSTLRPSPSVESERHTSKWESRALLQYQTSLPSRVQPGSKHVDKTSQGVEGKSKQVMQPSLEDQDSNLEVGLSAAYNKGFNLVELINSRLGEHLKAKAAKEEQAVLKEWEVVDNSLAEAVVEEDFVLI